ncbi:MAG TPA: peptidylprolyl isomerase [Minicystis sp.]|nr:peptidylprolyl isomerase [Minicystis sp.]
MTARLSLAALAALAASLTFSAGCGKHAPASTDGAARADERDVPAKPVASVTPSPDDPVHGRYTLADATAGLPPGRALVATIDTDMGALSCTLYPDKAPITVANFVGLARGGRPWKAPDGAWVKRPAYDGTVFHRVIQGFMIQGGDPKKDGSGDAGYVIPDEIWQGATHDRAGLLCMANHGPNTGSIQFFITDAPAPHLDGGYTILGECAPVETVHRLASVAVRGDRPTQPPVIRSVRVTRR